MRSGRIASIALLCLVVTCVWAKEPPAVPRRFEIHQREFERKIGYEAALQRHVGNEVVQFDWLKLAPCGALPQWKIADAKLTRFHSGDFADEWVWYYRWQDAAIKVSVTSFRNDKLAALKAISDFANRSNMETPPYARGPENIGTISLVLISENSYSIYWAFRNLKFEVEGDDKATVSAVAHCLQDIATSKTRRR